MNFDGDINNFDAYCLTLAPGKIHLGIAFLERAAARLILVEHGQMSIEDAIMGLAPAFWDLVDPMSGEAIADYERMERLYPHVTAKPEPSSSKRRVA